MHTRHAHTARRITIPLPRSGPGTAAGTVLLVTADAELRVALSCALETRGFLVLTASHSGHAQLACLTGPRVDILVADLAMEEMSGPALAECIRRHLPGVQAVYLGQPGTPPCEGVLVRPFTREELVTAVERAVVTES